MYRIITYLVCLYPKDCNYANKEILSYKTRKRAKLIWYGAGESKTCENNDLVYH